MAISTCAGPNGASMVSVPQDHHVNLIAPWRGLAAISMDLGPRGLPFPLSTDNYPEADRGTGLPAAPGGGASAVHENIEVSI
jgi:hypothetical protein